MVRFNYEQEGHELMGRVLSIYHVKPFIKRIYVNNNRRFISLETANLIELTT
jgi:hypothetical protein